jgi:hypothetical protein
MMEDWYIGEKIVCIEDFNDVKKELDADEVWNEYPQVNETYIIRDIAKCQTNEGEFIAFHLEELKNPKYYYSGGLQYDEFWFGSAHFRPLTETNIDLFYKILEDLNIKRKIPENVE